MHQSTTAHAVRLLVRGNSKLGRQIFSFSLPAGVTCPGQTPSCAQACYAMRGFYLKPNVRRVYRRNLRLTRRPDFADRIVREIQSVRPAVVRIHASGDFHTPAYVRSWAEVARRCPGVQFYAYTRSWRLPEFRRPLRELASVPNVQLWYSCDRDTGLPARKPRSVRIAWMQSAADDLPPRSDLVFRVHKLRQTVVKRVGLALVCPVENGATGGRTDCGRCGVCWR